MFPLIWAGDDSSAQPNGSLPFRLGCTYGNLSEMTPNEDTENDSGVREDRQDTLTIAASPFARRLQGCACMCELLRSDSWSGTIGHLLASVSFRAVMVAEETQSGASKAAGESKRCFMCDCGAPCSMQQNNIWLTDYRNIVFRWGGLARIVQKVLQCPFKRSLSLLAFGRIGGNVQVEWGLSEGWQNNCH